MFIDSKNVYSVSIIGCGDIGYKYDRGKSVQGAFSHFRSFYTSPYFQIVGVSDINEEIINEINEKFNIPAYNDFRILIEKVPADVVVVATPDQTHATILKKIVYSYPRVVICEKPLASGLNEVESLVQTYDLENVGLAVNYYRRYLNEYVEIGRQISSGEVGNVQSVVIYYSRGFIHNASHYIDLIFWWFGEPTDILVESIRKGLSADDPTLSVLLKYQRGLEVR
ncbi:MAG: Gfo/Idh/MocA family oxidoreductase, partial [Candidatus Thermoplasmatota archaeon]|nr:Gfo/Idh/MocA family oxidoreductase [Candidatus Thermoplasmatota archaeon]